jgi:HD-like signal output (HDOD) protein
MTPKMLAEKVRALITLPDVVLRVNELLNKDDTTNAELVELILNDPALTAQLLKLVNTTFYGFPNKIDSISRAVSMIGQKELRNMVLTTTVTNSFEGIPEDLVDMDTFWYHSITSGVLARLLAHKFHRQDYERLFIAGLLHSVGKLIFFIEYPQQSSQILSLKDQGQEAIDKIERKAFGFNYAELGAELLKEWKLPENIWELIDCQLDPLHAKHYIEDVCILNIAAHIADSIEPCSKRDIEFEDPELDYNMPAFVYMQLQAKDIMPLIEEASYQAFEILSIIRPEATVIF